MKIKIAVLQLLVLLSGQFLMAQSVHLVGYTKINGNETASYWKDGVLTILPIESALTISKAHAVKINGNDVHIVGFKSNRTTPTALYWKNGTPIEFKAGSAYIEDLDFIGSDMLLIGNEYNKDGNGTYAQVWKNGIPTPLTKKKTGNLTAMAISGNDVYLTGTEKASKKNAHNYYPDVASYWKNGTLVSLTNGETDSYAYDIFVNGQDVYVAGYERIPGGESARYWKNGVAVVLDNLNSKNSVANGIFVSGSDIYVAGYIIQDGKYVATLWKNGVPTELAPRTTLSAAKKVFVFGEDVYVVGYESVDSKNMARCWKNGKAMEIDNAENGLILSIVVN